MCSWCVSWTLYKFVFFPTPSKTNAHAVWTEVFKTGDSGNTTAFVHRGAKIKQKLKVSCRSLNHLRAANNDHCITAKAADHWLMNITSAHNPSPSIPVDLLIQNCYSFRTRSSESTPQLNGFLFAYPSTKFHRNPVSSFLHDPTGKQQR